ncbi:MAG: hypothetical protein KAU21_18695, partial [Gammaproteobacteria bacterium]|nr:hypothetical protein [Gammaproteobacteria bacterium]
PLPGFWAKLLLVTGLVQASAPLYLTALAVLLTATVIEAHYFMSTAIKIYSKGKKKHRKKHLKHLKQAPLNLAIVSVLGLVILITVFTVAPLGNKLNQIAVESSDRALYIRTTLSQSPPLKGAPQQLSKVQ